MDDEPINKNQFEIRLRELSEETGIGRDTIDGVYHCVCTLNERRTKADDSHVAGRELCCALIRDLGRLYREPVGEMLVELKIPKSEDIGRIVFGLVDKKLIEANETDSPADFEGVYDADNIGSFLRDQHISGSRVKLHMIPHYTMWLLYIVGTILVLGSYVDLVSPKLAWIGWGAAMLGFLMQFVRLPEMKRF